MIVEKIIKVCLECGREFSLPTLHCEKCHITGLVDEIVSHDCKRSSDA